MMRVTLDGRERPAVLVVSTATNVSTIQDLFVRRGFAVMVAPSLVAIERYLARGGAPPEAAVLDFTHAEASRALSTLAGLDARPILVGMAADEAVLRAHPALDAGFVAPVDRARLFVRLLELVAAKHDCCVTTAASRATVTNDLTTISVSWKPRPELAAS
jgi:hypothetical protein